MDITLLNEKKEGKNYQTDNFKILYRYKNTIAGNNDINIEELIYLISGSAGITLKDSTWTVEAPAKIEFPAKHIIESRL